MCYFPVNNRKIPSDEITSIAENYFRVQIGITDRGFEDIGEVEEIKSLIDPKDFVHVNGGDSLLRIIWYGNKLTCADELYHSVWDNVEGTFDLRSPISGILRKLYVPDHLPTTNAMDPLGIGPNTCLAQLIVDEKSMKSIELNRKEWMIATEYRRYTMQQPRGKFF